MKMTKILFGISLLLLASCSQQSGIENTPSTDLLGYVNPFIGTSNFGATNPGAIAPRGMVSVSPFNVSGAQNLLEKDSRWLSTPYVYENTFLTGFSHVNLKWCWLSRFRSYFNNANNRCFRNRPYKVWEYVLK